MAVSVHPVVNDQLTRAHVRLLRQRLEQERRQTDSALLKNGRQSEPILEEKYEHLKEAARQRKELLERLKHEQQLSRHLLRPRSNPVDDVTPRHRPSRRTESQPQLAPEQRQHFHPVRLQPLDQTPVLPPVASFPLLPPPPAPFQVIQPYQMTPPQVFSQLPAPPAAPTNTNTRSDMYEMMMMQNAQMHQMIMQQLMLNSIQPRNNQAQSSHNGHSTERERLLPLDVDDLRKLLKTPRENRRPHAVYPDYRYGAPAYAMPSVHHPLLQGYHRPLEPIPVPPVVLPVHGIFQPTSQIPAPGQMSHLQASYLQQQKERDEDE